MKHIILVFILIGTYCTSYATLYTMINSGNYNDSSNWDVFPDFDNTTTADTIRIAAWHASGVNVDYFIGDLGALIFSDNTSSVSGSNFYLGDTPLIIEDNASIEIGFYNSWYVNQLYSFGFSELNFFIVDEDADIDILLSDGNVDLNLWITDGASMNFPYSTFLWSSIRNEGLMLLNDDPLWLFELQNCGEIRNNHSTNTTLQIECYNFTQEWCEGAGSITGYDEVIFNCDNSFITDLTIDP